MMPEQTTQQEVERILDWPPETWSDEEIATVHERRSHLQHEMFTLADQAERFNRNLTVDERETFERLQAEFQQLGRLVPSQR
jgi:hypothetical protein